MLKKLLYICVFLLSLGQYSAVATFGNSKIYLFDIFIPVFSVLGIFYFLNKGTFKLPKNSIFYFFFYIVALIMILPRVFYINSPDLLVVIFYQLRFVSYLISSVVIYNLIVSDNLTANSLINLFIFSGLFISLAGFVQLIFLPDLSVLSPELGWDPHKNRLVSTFFDPNYVGGYLSIILSLMLFNGLNKNSSKLLFIVIFTAFLLTYSRSAYGMFALIIFCYGITKNLKVLLVSLFIAVLAFFAVPRIQTRLVGITDPADSASLRLVSWSHTMQIAKDNFWFGVGYNNYKNSLIDYGYISSSNEIDHSTTGSDSSLLFVLSTTGIIGFVIYIFAYLLPALTSRNLLISAITLGLLLESQFVNSLFFPQIMFIWFTIINTNLLSSRSLQL